MQIRLTWILLLAGIMACGCNTDADLPKPVVYQQPQADTPQKLRILVDKVVARTSPTTTEEHIKEMVAAGFNVIVPRRGAHDLKRVKQVARWTQKHKVKYMPWMQGTAHDHRSAKDLKGPTLMVWSNGMVGTAISPNSDKLWAWKSKWILEYAKLSKKYPSIMGVFLDYEIYSGPKPDGAMRHGYPLSYDLKILREFAEAKHLEMPELAPAERMAWLVKIGWHESFIQFQVMSWRDRCRKLRQEVDKINPSFQFCVYTWPSPNTFFFTEGIYPEWGSEKAPLILADPATYGRSKELHKAGLKRNRRRILAGKDIAKRRGVNFQYVGGIDPVVGGADPEFSARNAVMISEISDGYWIFYELHKNQRDQHPDYWRWFTRANLAIVKGNYAFQNEPRQSHDPAVSDK